MSLLREMQEHPLDVGYAGVARNRPRPVRSLAWWRQGVVVLACAAMALGGVWATRELRAPQEGVLPARALLVEEIEDRSATGDRLAATNAEILAETERLRSEALAGQDAKYQENVRRLGVASGNTRVTGPGLVIELADSAAAQAGQPDTDDERVHDVDLQVLVNSLWSAGAEAIAVDGHRLSSTSAIRTAGQAIFVNLDPVLSPYVIEVIGDPAQMQTDLTRTPASTHLGVLRTAYDITVEISTSDELELAALPTGNLRFAEPLEEAPDGEDVARAPADVSGSGQNAAAGRGSADDTEVS
ncbi:DUF881 domain-containing protein [Georgenia subflava]|uniref:DUF881 domain-containing protein n=1 Tax=Georgenia subflava TaxID=1622177 RepID=A0A6N7EE91_9MICO|nr:DUF881 domain-containing protein [Georgenia subflava]MPV36742.1 DUF881 domain-containing protein [Georgenia subflava]